METTTPALANPPTKPTEPAKRARGRPAVAGGVGGFKQVMTTLYQQHIDIAARIHPQRSVAVRLALELWEKQNPAKPEVDTKP
jgi:hypothetical protein